jgi:hypothetical protein
MPSHRKWLVALLLPLTLTAAAAEPTADASVPTAVEHQPGEPDRTDAPAFDFRSTNVREIVRATAATQASSDYRVESAPRAKPDLVAALKQNRPAPRKPKRAPRLPGPPPSCDGFISCGVETLLGLNDSDDQYEYEQLYARVNRDRLMRQGAFTSWNDVEATVTLPMSPGEASKAGAPLITVR